MGNILTSMVAAGGGRPAKRAGILRGWADEGRGVVRGREVRRAPAPSDDVGADRCALLRGTAIISVGYAVGASLQSAWIYSALVPEWADVDLWRRLAANGLAVAGLLVALSLLRVHRAAGAAAVTARVLTAAVVMSLLRVGVQVALGVHPADDRLALTTEAVTGALVGVIASAVGVGAMVSRRRMRRAARAAEREAVSVELALEALQDEEIRVRRQVAEGLHGTVQQRLLLIDARLATAEERASQPLPDVAEDIAWARAELAASRERDVRQLSRLLYPERLELGLVPAVRALLGRLPATISTRLQVGDELRELDDPAREGLTIAERLLAARVVEEAITNALKNGPPSLVQVALHVEDDVLTVRVTNDGHRFEPAGPRDPESGTSRLDQRLRLAHGSLSVRPREPSGAVVEATLPLGKLQADVVTPRAG